MEEKIEEVKKLIRADPSDRAIERKLNRIQSLLSKTSSIINKVEAKIDGKVRKICLTIDRSCETMVTNVAQVLTEGLQLSLTWSDINSHTKYLGMILIACRALLVAGNVSVYVLSKEKLEELQKKQEKIKDITETLDSFKNKLIK